MHHIDESASGGKREMNWRNFILALALAAPAQWAAASVDSDLDSAVQAIAAEVARADGVTLGQAQRQQLYLTLQDSDFDRNAQDKVREFGRVLSEAIVHRSTAVNTAALAETLTPIYKKAILEGDVQSGLQMAMLLTPIAIDGGFCSGEVHGDAGLVCGFASAPSGLGITGGTESGDIRVADPQSTLGQVLTALGAGQSSTSSNDGGSWWDSDDGTYHYPTPVGDISVNFLYGYYLQWTVHCATACRGALAAYGGIFFNYLANSADSIGFVMNGGGYCDFSCSIGAYLDDKWFGGDGISYFLEHYDKRYQNTHGPSKMVHVIATGCTVVEGDYSTNPVYQYFTANTVSTPFDDTLKMRLGTYHQVAGSESPRHMYPRPTSSSERLLTDPTTINGSVTGGTYLKSWEYDFTEIQMWSQDLVFAAELNSDAADACYARISIRDFIPEASSNIYARGNQFWLIRGWPTTGDYDLTPVNLVFYFYGGHLPTV